MTLIRVLLVGTAMSTFALCGTASAQQSGQQSDEAMDQNSNRGSQQGQQISPGEVRAYFRQVQNQINQAVESGNPQRLHDWTQSNIADGADFQAVIEMGRQSGLGGSKEIRIVSFNKNDMLRRQQAALSLAPELLSRIENYDFGIRVQSIQPLGDAAAVVKTRISESGTIGVSPSRQQLGANEGTVTRGETQGMGPRQGQDQNGDQDQEQAQNGGWNGNGNDGGNGGPSGPFQRGPGGGGGFQQHQMHGQMGQNQGQTGQTQGVSFNADAECTQLVQRDRNSGRLTIGLSNCHAQIQF
jgi:hypothetical protein